MKPIFWIFTLCIIIKLQNVTCTDRSELNQDNNLELEDESEDIEIEIESSSDEEKNTQIQNLVDKLQQARAQFESQHQKTADIKKKAQHERIEEFQKVEKERIKTLLRIEEQRKNEKAEQENAIKGIEKNRNIVTSNAINMKKKAAEEREEAVKEALKNEDENMKKKAFEREMREIKEADDMEKKALEAERRIKRVVMKKLKKHLNELRDREMLAYRREKVLKRNAIRRERRTIQLAEAAEESAQKDVNDITRKLIQLGVFATGSTKKNFDAPERSTTEQSEVNKIAS